MKKNDPRVVSKNGCAYMRGSKQLIQLIEKVCATCAEPYYTRKFIKSESKFCSTECRGIADRGEGNPNWKGGRSRHIGGYIRVQVYGGRNTRGRIFEHVQVMEQHLGRPLTADETVHHKNGIRDDNRLENLELWSSRHPKGQKVEDLVEWAKEILARYN